MNGRQVISPKAREGHGERTASALCFPICFSITVSDLDRAMEFLEPVLDFLGYTEHERGSNSGEFPFGVGGYYAVYFLAPPDNLKFEYVHMPALARFYGGQSS
jgi:hypothetical protein